MSILLAIGLVLASAFIHYEFLWRLNRALPKFTFYPRRGKVLLAVMGAMCSHYIQIVLFAYVFYAMQGHYGTTLGNEGVDDDSFGDFIYFSMETYTSLGIGDVLPRQALRLLVGIESITGLIMISWTASFTYLEMHRYWEETSSKKGDVKSDE